ncbi:DUF3072 domain-containing protein [Rhodococcus koreensis]|uniref:DUF3072 domain-containing protein n=1 Tax=Rhodococcus koreensis TaxID=99653 RepID=A0A1H4RH17_9NOCA|nr:DUF3072 domain-containing protein [Rhodococcus koreensis]QSE82940.1 DUF3072 domain-containing protein [Rhodococcus koreensis]SEC31044.1 Protein of unknown function [Rhodococcus koreensis]
MADIDPTEHDVSPTPEKDPDDWITGDEPMTGPQRSYLHTLAQELGATVPDDLTKVTASKLIDELQLRSGRGARGEETSGA